MVQHDRNFGIHWRILALSAAAAIGLGGCGAAAKDTPVSAMEEASVILVEASVPKVGDLTLTTEFIGTVEPNEVVSVLPKVSGTVLNTYYKVGDLVNKGDLLFQIDPQDVQLQVNIARAQLKSSQAQLMSAQAQMDQALGSTFDVQMAQLEGQVKQAKNAYSLARQQLRDYNDGANDAMDSLLYGMGSIENQLPRLESQLDEATKSAAAAEAKYRELEAKNDLSPGSVTADELKAALENATSAKVVRDNISSNLSKAESNLTDMNDKYKDMDSDDDDPTRSQLRTAVRNAQTAYESTTKIYELTKDEVRDDAVKVANASLGMATAGFETASASFEASARQLDNTKVYAPIGGVIEQKNITEQAVAAPSSPAYTISNKSSILVTFFVPSDAVAQLSGGERVEVDYGSQKYVATITEIGTMVDPQSGLFKVKAVVDGGSSGLLTGLSVKVRAATAKASQSVLIPQSVVYYDTGKPYIYTLNGSTAVKTYITTGVTTDDQVEVLSGIGRSTRFVSSWNPNLIDGVTVTVSPESPQDDPVSPASEPAGANAASSESGSSDAKSSAASSADAKSSASSSSDAKSSDGAKYVVPDSDLLSSTDELTGSSGGEAAGNAASSASPANGDAAPPSASTGAGGKNAAPPATSDSTAQKDSSSNGASSKKFKGSSSKDDASSKSASSDSSRKLASKEG